MKYYTCLKLCPLIFFFFFFNKCAYSLSIILNCDSDLRCCPTLKFYDSQNHQLEQEHAINHINQSNIWRQDNSAGHMKRTKKVKPVSCCRPKQRNATRTHGSVIWQSHETSRSTGANDLGERGRTVVICHPTVQSSFCYTPKRSPRTPNV